MPTDVFISHASEDKKRLAPLLEALDNFSITYWIDNSAIGWGDRWLDRIKGGLTSSNIILIFVTEHFLAKEWTKYELNNSIELEKAGQAQLLPIVDVDGAVLKRELPALSEKNFLSASTPPAEIAERISEQLGRHFDRYWTHHHRPEYSGRIWIKLRAKKENHNKKHRYAINWGPWHRQGSAICRSDAAVALMHGKGADGLSLPLLFEVHPECYVTFGEGSPNVDNVQNINNFWVATKNSLKLFIAKRFLWS